MQEPNKSGNVVFRMALLGLLAGMLGAWLVAAGFSGAAAAVSSGNLEDVIWVDVDEATLRPQGEPLVVPQQYRVVAANLDALKAQLALAPPEFSQAAQQREAILSLPLPNGGFGRFRIVESPIMEPELAASFPDIKTYVAQGIDDPTAVGRLDQTPHGFHAMISSVSGTVFIDPYSREDVALYISYFKHDFSRMPSSPLAEDIVLERDLEQTNNAAAGGIPVGPQLRTYRLAVATTGEYTQFHGGTKAGGMAAIVTAINRVNGIYERDAAVRLILVANNDLIVYTNSAADPYSNSNGSTMLSQNQGNLDTVIGSANYDVGHVFSTGGGGIAYLGVPCDSVYKARGVTGLANPINDPFYVDYVAHEIGHQFGANHTFNGTAGSCGSGQRNASTAYEPGSGTTIMGYAGICGDQNIQPNSDDHFHTASFDQIVAYTTSSLGSSCAAIINTGNAAPVADAGSSYTVPKETAFMLTGSATDADGDTLTYGWEQFDLGPAGHPNSPSGTAPLFRSFTPTLSPSRTLPQLTDLINNTQTIGEILPSTSRSLSFRLTVRDNRAGSGGVAHDTVTHSVTADAGPFRVTAPNTAVSWPAGEPASVTWDVANTDGAPVNCTGVNIRLSTDSGYSYPHVLAANTPNDGSANVTIPNTTYTASARVKVACTNNIFFDISNTNFTIVSDLDLNRHIYLPLTLKGE
jgi:hypothetical protein